MAISNNSTGLRPGVCTSSTRPTAPYEGQMIYETDTDLTYVWGGSAWQQVSGGTAVGNSGLVYVTSTTATSGTSVSINNCFSATYDAYKIVATNVKTTGVAAPTIRLRASGTDSIVQYYFNGIYLTYTSATVNGWNGSNAAQYDTLMVTDTSLSGGSIDVLNPFIAGTTNFFSFGNDTRTTGGGGRYTTGIHAVSTSYDGFTWIAGSTITSTTLTVYGYRK